MSSLDASTATQEPLDGHEWQSARSLMVTGLLTVAIVLVLFVVMRSIFPDPPIEGSICPASLGEPAYSECVKAWPESHRARDAHRLNTALAVTFIAISTALLLTRSPLRLRSFSIALALAMAAGFFATYGAIGILGSQRGGWGALAGGGLFAIASLLSREQRRWPQFVIAATIGACVLLATGLVSFMFFTEGS